MFASMIKSSHICSKCKMQTTFSGQKNSGRISVNTASLCVDSDLGLPVFKNRYKNWNKLCKVHFLWPI